MLERYILDSSSVLALLQKEPGEERVREALRQGECLISTVNIAEVAAKLASRGLRSEEIDELCDLPNLAAVELSRSTALASGDLVIAGRALGLSLGDRNCLALGMETGAVVLTADRAWGRLQINAKIDLIR